MSEHWSKIPAELQALKQWCLAAPDKSPWTMDGQRASSTEAYGWCEFPDATRAAREWNAGIGLVLSADDPFTCIDIDIKADSTPEQLMRAELLVRTFDSYTERSVSGLGYHIWIRGFVGEGARREGVEVYDRGRFMVCTGNVVRDKPIEDRQDIVNILIEDIRRAQGVEAATKHVLVEAGEEEPDEVIWQRASTAENAEKFLALFYATSCTGTGPGKVDGSYVALGYPSQSEADLSLLSMLTFYSKSNAQVRRLFRLSGLGQRAKATKDDRYLDRTLQIIRGREEREHAAREQGAAMAAALVQAVATKELPKIDSKELDWPPGFMGEIAKWLYDIAPRPVKEVAIVSALGVFAGICGRSYRISNSGLNLYLVLVARSAIGKEAIHSGISRLVHSMLSSSPSIGSFIDFADYASGPALIKSLATRHSFCNVAGEWGRKLRKMSDDHTDGPMASLRTAMTNLYQKSSSGTIVGGIGYSDKEKDVKAVDGVAFSMIGETTPDTFYESLTNTMMQDGFMSRFIVVEYTGDRPPINNKPLSPPHPLVLAHMLGLSDYSASIVESVGVEVATHPDAQRMLDDFNNRCDTHINATDDESWRQMWNRAHLKVLKVSALLAAADNPNKPVVTPAFVTWALELIERDICIMGRKMADGDVGDGDAVRERKLLAVIKEYLSKPISLSYGIPDAMRLTGVVPRRFLQLRVQRTNSFLKHRNGQIFALDNTIKSLVDSGYLVELSKDKQPADWGFTGKSYRVLNLPT